MDAATPPARAGSPADEGDGYEPLRRAVRQAVAGEKIGREAMRALSSGASKRSNRGLAIVLTTLTSLGFLGGLSAFHSDLGLPEAAMTKGLFPVGDPLRSIRFDGRLQSNGTIQVRETVGFADGHGGSLPLAPPCPETAEAVAQCTRDVRVDGTPVEGQVDAPLLFVPVGAETAVVTYEVLGTVQAWSDVGIADVQLYPTNPRATHYNDTLSVDGTLRFPGPVGRGPLETHLHGGAATPVVRNEPAAISFATRARQIGLPTSLAVAFPAALVPDVGPLHRFPDSPGLDQFRTTQSILDIADRAVGPASDSVDAGAAVLNLLAYTLAFVFAAVLWLVVLIRGLRRLIGLVRRPATAATPVDAPPSAHDPAVVAALMGKGSPRPNAVAGTILSLAERGQLELQDLPGEAFVVRRRRPVGAAPVLTPSDVVVLEALRLSGSEEPDGASAPPLWKGQARWWPLLQADVRGRAVAAGLAMRSSSSRLVLLAVTLTALGFGLVRYVGSPPLFFLSALLLPPIVAAVAVRFGYSLTPEGRTLRARWHLFAEHLRATGTLADAPPAAVVIVGSDLAYGTVLNVAHKASGALTPDVSRRRT